MIGNGRRNNLIAQHLEVALVYKDMLGLDEAINYLARESVPRDITERVLLTEQKRGTLEHPAPCEMAARPPACRRKNLVHDAIVEAALKVERRLGAARALGLLRAEGVEPQVIERVLSERPRQIRKRTSAG
jgi:hypothetical protein